MTAPFGSLRHDHIGANIYCLLSLFKVCDLDDQRCASMANRSQKRARVTEGQHHRSRLANQRVLDGVDVDGSALKPDTPGFVGALGNERQLMLQPIPITAAAAEQSEPPPLETAAANAPPADPPIGASAIGYRNEHNSVNCVRNAMPAIITGRCPRQKSIEPDQLAGTLVASVTVTDTFR